MEELKDLFNFSYVVIDKPYGPTSHQVSAWVKEILNVKKTGHAGTLDPHVTGVL
ncbi:MAG: RNA-guided pseudouridylation complex pseudouridine synthase subunit Cbf5, partial [Thermoplasmata archaeon]